MPDFQSLKKEIEILKDRSQKMGQLINDLLKSKDDLDRRISNVESKLSVAKGVTATVNENAESVRSQPSQKPISAKEIAVKQPEKSQILFEEKIGIKWFARIGILALVLGVGFFIKYAIDMNWISYLARIILGIVFGIVLIVFGEFISKNDKYTYWAKTLIGGGFAIVYFVTFAAYYFENYRTVIGISRSLDVILLSLIVIFAILLSLKDDSRIIAAESFFLGYVTALLSSNFGLMTLVYSSILTIGLVAVVSYKKWPLIGLGGVMASYAMYSLWVGDNPNSFAYASFILISYFVAFTVQSLFLMREKKALVENIATILLNSAFFFIFYYIQINKFYPHYAGLFTFLLSIFYFLWYYFSQSLEEKKIATAHLYLALLYATLAVPICLNKELVTIIWALEALILTAMFLETRINTLKISSYIVGAITAFKTLFYDANVLHKLDPSNILQSTRAISFLITITCFYIVYKLLKDNKKLLPEEEYIIPQIYSWIASGYLVLIVFLELMGTHPLFVSLILSALVLLLMLLSKVSISELRYQAVIVSSVLFFKTLFYDLTRLNAFNIHNLIASSRFFALMSAIIAFYLTSVYLEKRKSRLDKSEIILPNIYSYAATILAIFLIIVEMKGPWISVGWGVLALAIMAVGFIYRKRYLRIQGIIILLLTILKVFLYDTENLKTIYRTASYITLGVILLLASFAYTKYKERLKEIL